MGEPERLESQTDVSDTCTRMQSTASVSNTPANVSVTLKTPDLPARGAELHVGEPKRLESQTDISDACTHMQRAADDSRQPADTSECVSTPQNSLKNSNLPGASPELCPKELHQRPGNDVNASGTLTHMQSSRINAKMAAKSPEDVSIAPKNQKSPIGARIQFRGATNGPGNRTDRSIVHMDMQGIGTDLKTAGNTGRNVSIGQTRLRKPSSPLGSKLKRKPHGSVDRAHGHAEHRNRPENG